MTDVLGLFSWPLLLLGAYLVGSIPSAQLLARIKGVDLRRVGTGNIGAGNLTHSVGSRWGFVAAVFDGLKGLLPVLVARYVLDMGLAASGMAALDPVLIVWVGGWSLAGWRIGGGFAGFLGWGLLPLLAMALGRPGPETLFLVLLSATLMLRRAQGNPADPEGAGNALRRLIYDSDPVDQQFPETADEASTQ